jgi:hypothetical protein
MCSLKFTCTTSPREPQHVTVGKLAGRREPGRIEISRDCTCARICRSSSSAELLCGICSRRIRSTRQIAQAVRVRREKRAARYDVKVGPVTFKASRIDRPPEPRDAGAGVGGDVANGTLPRSSSGRRLRNWIILANVAAWILIALVIRAIFF